MYEEYKDYAIDLVCRNFEVSRESLLNKTKKTEDVINARCVLVHMLDFNGVPPCTIEKWTQISVQNQAYLLQGFQTRKRASPWFDVQMINLIRDAKQTSPVPFRAHDKDGNVVTHQGLFK